MRGHLNKKFLFKYPISIKLKFTFIFNFQFPEQNQVKIQNLIKILQKMEISIVKFCEIKNNFKCFLFFFDCLRITFCGFWNYCFFCEEFINYKLSEHKQRTSKWIKFNLQTYTCIVESLKWRLFWGKKLLWILLNTIKQVKFDQHF